MGLGVLDMVLLVLSLILSAMVGVYHSVMGRKATPLEYMLGGRTMSPFPLALSLMVGLVSAITIMGNAGEMYAYGTQLWIMDIGMVVGLLAVAKFVIPVMYPLKMVSLYQVSVRWERIVSSVLPLNSFLVLILSSLASCSTPIKYTLANAPLFSHSLTLFNLSQFLLSLTQQPLLPPLWLPSPLGAYQLSSP